MKKNLLRLFVLSGMLITMNATVNAQNSFPATGAAGIGTTTPNASSLLDIQSTTKGILIPRMTQVQRNAIVSPTAGLLIYQTSNTKGFYYYTGTAWTAVSAKGANTTLANLVAPTAVNQSLLPGTTGAIDLGSSTNAWKDIYASGTVKSTNLQMTNGAVAGNVLQSDASGNATWVLPSSLGVTGPAGPQGSQGPQGATGPQGSPGFLPAGISAGNTPYWNGTFWEVSSSNVFNNNANVGIGTIAPAAKLDVSGNVKINDGTQGTGKVLTSDADGLATWQTPTGGGWGLTGNTGTTVSNYMGTTDNRSLRFRTNNTEKVIIDSLGKVGIGTTTPSDKLTVLTGINSNGLVHTDGTRRIGTYVGGTTGGGWFGTFTNHSLCFFTNNSASRMIISASGNVGIGTTAPAVGSLLDVAGEIRAENVNLQRTNGPNYINFNDANDLDFRSISPTYTNANIRMTITPGGNVGIGTTTPIEKFDVTTGSEADGDKILLGNRAITINDRYASQDYAAKIWAAWPSYGQMHFGINGFAGAASTIVPTMTITNTSPGTGTVGRVSIGTTTPAAGYALTVSGKIICTELKVQLTPFPDYVFANDYNLKSIDAVEQHIKTYSRLPGMPSACDVEENGMSIGEMQGKVVEKVEENTLYIIQLSKENKELKEQLKSIQAQLDLMKK